MALYFQDVDASANKLFYQIDGTTTEGPETLYDFRVSMPTEQQLPSEDFQDLADAFALAVANAINTYRAAVTATTTRRWYEDVSASTPVTTL